MTELTLEGRERKLGARARARARQAVVDQFHDRWSVLRPS
jgi:hypothetical protein